MTMTVAPKSISVIITTYNAPQMLDKVLLGYARQTCKHFEVVVADDGSGAATAEVIERYRAGTGLAIQHVWHRDDGFRKCEILNKAIVAANGNYLVFTDGDCIPRADFLAVHHREAAAGRFLSGTYNNLPESFGELITDDAIISGDAFDLRWLLRRGLPWSRKCMRLSKNRLVAGAMNALTTTRPTWNGCNASGWKSDIVAVGGFDQRMRYGGLDRELGLRLVNAGVAGKQIRFKAICLHVDHPRGYANEKDIQQNMDIRRATIRNRSTFTEYGIGRAA